MKVCGNSSNTKSEAALFVSRDNSKKYSGKGFRCNKSGQMKNFCTVEQCSVWKKFRHNESKCFQKSQLDEKSENRRSFSKSCEFLFYCGSDGSKNKELILDSGCTSYIFCDKCFFTEIYDVSWKICVNAINSVPPVRGQCVAKISLLDKRGVSHVLNLSDCFYVPDHSRNLLCVSAKFKRVQKSFLMILVNFVVLIMFLFLLFKGMACMWLKLFQYVLKTFLARVKLILIFGIADWVTITSAMSKSYQSWFKEWKCTIQIFRSLSVTFVQQTNSIVKNLLVLTWLCEKIRSWNWFIPMLGVQWKLPLQVVIGMFWASLTATVASLVLIS